MSLKKLFGRRGKARDSSPESTESASTLGRAGSIGSILFPSNTEQSTEKVQPTPDTSVRTDRHGLLPMSSPTNTSCEENYSLDIIAIHGITGDAYDTWTHENGKLWLRDFISEDFPGARVFSFGYNADVFFSRSKGIVESFARSLLEGITNERLEEKVTNPPCASAQ